MHIGHRQVVRGGVAVGVAALVLLVSACGDDSEEGAGGDSSADLSGTSWNLSSASIDGDDVTAIGVPTLAFAADGTLSGSTGCNRFNGTYTQDGDDLTISVGGVTLVACVDPAATAQEAAILAHLAEVATFSSGDQLVLKNSDDDVLLTYDPGLTSVEGTSWTARGVNNGTGGVESSLVSETITADFGADGALSGFSGCNTYNGTYQTSDDGSMTITDVATTRKACDEAAMTVEGQYLAALGQVATFVIDGDSLNLRDASGATQVNYVLAP